MCILHADFITCCSITFLMHIFFMYVQFSYSDVFYKFVCQWYIADTIVYMIYNRYNCIIYIR